MSSIDKFTIRVYGLAYQEGKILLNHENIDGFQMLKFPGGGLEFNEGLIDGLRREFMEELETELVEVDHLFTNPQFIQSTFRENEQVLAVYYKVKLAQPLGRKESIQPTRMGSQNHISSNWVPIHNLLWQELTFETDQAAMRLLIDQINTAG